MKNVSIIDSSTRKQTNYDVLRGHSRNTSIVQDRAKLDRINEKKRNKNSLSLITIFLCRFNDTFNFNTHNIQVAQYCVENINIITPHIYVNR